MRRGHARSGNRHVGTDGAWPKPAPGNRSVEQSSSIRARMAAPQVRSESSSGMIWNEFLFDVCCAAFRLPPSAGSGWIRGERSPFVVAISPSRGGEMNCRCKMTMGVDQNESRSRSGRSKSDAHGGDSGKWTRVAGEVSGRMRNPEPEESRAVMIGSFS
jgi:hypothetical protein